MTRLPDWPWRLDAFMCASTDRPFEWGAHDCCLFVCDAIEAMTGVDVAAAYRGKYRSARGAIRLGSVESIAVKVTTEHGMFEIGPLYAGGGDVVLAESGEGPALGIVALNGRVALGAGKVGLVEVPQKKWRRAWRV